MAISNTVKPLSPAAIANAKKKGIGSNFQIGSSGLPEPLSQIKTPSVSSSTNGIKTPGLVSSPGSYKGIGITPGTDQEIRSQISAIDAPIQQPVQPTTPALTPAPTTTQPKKGLFSDVPSSLSYSSLVGSLANLSQTGSPQVQQAYEQAQKYNKQLEDFRESAADVKRGIFSAPTSARVMQGRDQAVQQANAEKEAALGAQFQGATNLFQGSLTGQGQQIGGLGSAAGLAAPSVVAQGQAVFNPLTGETNSGGNFDVTTNANNFAKNVLSNAMTYDQAVSALGYSNVGKAALDNAILQAGGNPLALQAQGSTQQGVIETQGAQVAAYQSAHQQAQNLQAQLTDLITKFGLNPSDLNVVNAGIQKIAQNTSDARYKVLKNYLADIASRYAQVLTPTGGSQTDTVRETASGMIDGIASGSSIQDVLNALDQQAQAVIAGVPTTTNTQPAPGGSNTAKVGKYNYTFQNGKWVLAP